MVHLLELWLPNYIDNTLPCKKKGCNLNNCEYASDDKDDKIYYETVSQYDNGDDEIE